MGGIGLVLAGGGGKGAYQIGVWKYLEEVGIDKYVSCVSGTSVGALNAALFAAGNYKAAEVTWRNIAPKQILSSRKISAEDVIKWVAGIAVGTAGGMSGHFTSSLRTLVGSASAVTMGAFAPLLATALSRSYAFSRDGLKEIMDHEVDFSNIQSGQMPCFATCMRVPNFEIERFDLRDYSPEDAKTILLASSAIPIVFDKILFEGKYYYDGGLPIIGDNVPVEPVYETGVETIIVVHLSRDQLIDKRKYPNARIIEVIPQNDLGGPIDGTLDFTSEGSAWRIEQGYHDAVHVFDAFVKVSELRYASQKQLLDYQEKHHAFRKEMEKLAKRDEEIQRKKADDGFDDVCRELGL